MRSRRTAAAHHNKHATTHRPLCQPADTIGGSDGNAFGTCPSRPVAVPFTPPHSCERTTHTTRRAPLLGGACAQFTHRRTARRSLRMYAPAIVVACSPAGRLPSANYANGPHSHDTYTYVQRSVIGNGFLLLVFVTLMSRGCAHASCTRICQHYFITSVAINPSV